jgi:hypothetical protein
VKLEDREMALEYITKPLEHNHIAQLKEDPIFNTDFQS